MQLPWTCFHQEDELCLPMLLWDLQRGAHRHPINACTCLTWEQERVWIPPGLRDSPMESSSTVLDRQRGGAQRRFVGAWSPATVGTLLGDGPTPRPSCWDNSDLT